MIGLDSIELEARIFGFLGNSSAGFRTKVPATFNLHILSKLRIGCSFKATSVAGLNATKAVEACRVINGTLYILKWDIILKLTGNSTNYVFKEFETIEKIRNEILIEEPEATVYIQVKIIELEFENSGINMGHIVRILKNPLFCHQEITHLKRVLAGIITIANAYNFPVIINSEIPERGCSHAEDTEWVSFLKKIPHFKNSKTENTSGSQYYFEKHRYSFPIAAQQYMTDVCMNWVDGDSEIPANYFHNNYLGAIFYPDDVHDQTALENVLATMLQFVFYRFHSLEIVCSSNFSSVYHAIKLVFELESNLIRNSSVFVSFFSSVNETLTNLTFFENFLDEFEVKGLSAIHGIHVELQEHSKTGNWHWYEDGIAPLDLSAYIKLQTIFENKFRQKNRAMKFGIVVNIKRYFELIQAIINPDAVHQEYVHQINRIDHIVFVDEFYVGYANQMHYLQRMFDDHLNYKRVIQKLIPDVEVYFRVEVSIELTADPKIMDDYRRILAHFERFSKSYNFRYFLVNAFDNQLGRKNGWWEIKNHSDLTEVQAYVEKETGN
ncbi:unnamed protein product [Orchesella dallaii]|uniref:Uncharacterized protein n=1 Tax=Orchesella dallaii TaxID=48710 RepID=A0ABP1R4Z1_9HEXA